MALSDQQVVDAVACPWCWRPASEACSVSRDGERWPPHPSRRRVAERAQLLPAPDLVADEGVHLTDEQAALARRVVLWVLGVDTGQQLHLVRQDDLALLAVVLRGAPPHRTGQSAGG